MIVGRFFRTFKPLVKTQERMFQIFLKAAVQDPTIHERSGSTMAKMIFAICFTSTQTFWMERMICGILSWSFCATSESHWVMLSATSSSRKDFATTSPILSFTSP